MIWIGSRCKVEAVVEKENGKLLKVAVTPIGKDHATCNFTVKCKSKSNAVHQAVQFSIEAYAPGIFYGHRILEHDDMQVSEISVANES